DRLDRRRLDGARPLPDRVSGNAAGAPHRYRQFVRGLARTGPRGQAGSTPGGSVRADLPARPGAPERGGAEWGRAERDGTKWSRVSVMSESPGASVIPFKTGDEAG